MVFTKNFLCGIYRKRMRKYSPSTIYARYTQHIAHEINKSIKFIFSQFSLHDVAYYVPDLNVVAYFEYCHRRKRKDVSCSAMHCTKIMRNTKKKTIRTRGVGEGLVKLIPLKTLIHIYWNTVVLLLVYHILFNNSHSLMMMMMMVHAKTGILTHLPTFTTMHSFSSSSSLDNSVSDLFLSLFLYDLYLWLCIQ